MNHVHSVIGTSWARRQNLTGKGVGVAVLDTGIYPHPDFAGRLFCFRDIKNGRKDRK